MIHLYQIPGGGILSYDKEDFVRWGFCPRGLCSKGLCPGEISSVSKFFLPVLAVTPFSLSLSPRCYRWLCYGRRAAVSYVSYLDIPYRQQSVALRMSLAVTLTVTCSWTQNTWRRSDLHVDTVACTTTRYTVLPHRATLDKLSHEIKAPARTVSSFLLFSRWLTLTVSLFARLSDLACDSTTRRCTKFKFDTQVPHNNSDRAIYGGQ